MKDLALAEARCGPFACSGEVMSWLSRVFLLVSAAFLGGSVALLLFVGISGPETYQHTTVKTTIRLAVFWLAVAALPSMPLWLPAIIPNRFSSLSRIVRWISAIILMCPVLLFGSTVTHNLSRWWKGWEWFPSVVLEGLLCSAYLMAAIVVLVAPEVRLWLKKSGAVINDEDWRMRKSLWRKGLIGLMVLFIGVMSIPALEVGYFLYEQNTQSEVWIRNWSGSDVRFERVTIDNQPIWGKPKIVVKTIRNLEKPWLDTRGDTVLLKFRTPKGNVELKLVTVNEMQKRETVSCTLDVGSRSHRFDAYYLGGRLACRSSGSDEPIPARGPNGEYDRRVNWPPEWPDGTYPQPIR